MTVKSCRNLNKWRQMQDCCSDFWLLLRGKIKSPVLLLHPSFCGQRSARSGNRGYRQLKDTVEKSATSLGAQTDVPRSVFVYTEFQEKYRKRRREMTQQWLSLVALQDDSAFQTYFWFPVTVSKQQ